MGTRTHTETVPLFSLTTVPPPGSSPTKLMSVKSVLTFQSRCHFQCSVSLVLEAVSGVINTFTVNKASSFTLNSKPLPRSGELMTILTSVLMSVCHRSSNLSDYQKKNYNVNIKLAVLFFRVHD